MCTVTYIPLGTNGYVLSSNRDESTIRLTDEPSFFNINGKTVIYPRDKTGNGTWIASSVNTTVCLLNGAFEPHVHDPPYKHSRGLVVTDYFKFLGFEDFINHFSFQGLEPFTMVVLERQKVFEIRWNGTIIFRNELPCNNPHIWSSVTLYNKETVKKRELWFDEWLSLNKGKLEESPQYVIDFHKSGGEGDIENNVLMKREGISQTVSITCVVKNIDSINFSYLDLLTDKQSFSSLSVVPAYV